LWSKFVKKGFMKHTDGGRTDPPSHQNVVVAAKTPKIAPFRSENSTSPVPCRTGAGAAVKRACKTADERDVSNVSLAPTATKDHFSQFPQKSHNSTAYSDLGAERNVPKGTDEICAFSDDDGQSDWLTEDDWPPEGHAEEEED
jgi:hypothetical protein